MLQQLPGAAFSAQLDHWVFFSLTVEKMSVEIVLVILDIFFSPLQ